MTTNIQTLLGLTPVRPYTNNKAVPLSCPDAALLYGLELEIEGIRVDPTELYVAGMTGTADNSLRETPEGRGWEYITKPATFSVAAFILNNFFQKAKLTQEVNYSERCSIHVHANVQDFTVEQLKTLCLLYQVFEKIFYAYAGEDRDKNIFCVPWSETTITHGIVDKLQDGALGNSLRRWQKYTGLNLIPVTSQGTVEFRHMPGTCDLQRILGWMQMIGCLFNTARNVPYADVEKLITQVNTTSDYKGLINTVFREWDALVAIPGVEELLEEGVLDVKYMLLSGYKNKTVTDYFNQVLAANPAPRPAGWWLDDVERIDRGVQVEAELRGALDRERARAAARPMPVPPRRRG